MDPFRMTRGLTHLPEGFHTHSFQHHQDWSSWCWLVSPACPWGHNFSARPRNKKHICSVVTRPCCYLPGTIFTNDSRSRHSKSPASCELVLCRRLEPFKLSLPLEKNPRGEGKKIQQDRYHIKQISIKHLHSCYIKNHPNFTTIKNNASENDFKAKRIEFFEGLDLKHGQILPQGYLLGPWSSKSEEPPPQQPCQHCLGTG